LRFVTSPTALKSIWGLGVSWGWRGVEGRRGTYVLVVGLLEADVEEPEVFVELDFGGHGETTELVLGYSGVR
jgi:hypothetical protein